MSMSTSASAPPSLGGSGFGSDAAGPIGNGDLVEMSVFDTPELSGKLRVSNSGEVALPLVGRLQVAGMKAEEAASLIRQKFVDGGYLRNPQVTVFIAEYATQNVSVVGEVKNPGIYPAFGAHHLLDYLSAAQGLTPLAGTTITITHAGKSGEPERVKMTAGATPKPENNPEILRLGELILAARPRRDMRCISVRFGNVMGSQGSVIPVFKEQIEKEGRITITHPEVTRFFMTIPEPVSLVLQAFTMGEQGDILVLDMGGPVRILDLAHSLIRQCGKSPSEIRIEIVGLRPGEKLHEELFYARERQLPTTNRKVKRTQSEIIPWPALRAHLEELISLTNSGTEVSIRAKMKEIIPEYSYQMEPVHVQNEPAENVFSPAIGIARPFAAGAGQD
jgi:protein involved in polysaccharide export with SLBB domain